MRPIGTDQELERRRRRAVELVKRGGSPAKVAYLLGCGRSSVSTWVKLDRQAAEDLAARPHAGPKPRLTDEQLKELDALLRKGATAPGRPNALWTARRVAEMIRRLGVTCRVEHARKVIRRRLGWSSQVPQRKARQRDDEEVARRRAEVLPRVVEAADRRRAHPMFPDESGSRMTPVVRRAYAPAGEAPLVEAFHRKGEVSAVGAVAVGPVRRGPAWTSARCRMGPTPRARTRRRSWPSPGAGSGGR